MNNWKVIFATAVIFGAGVITGGLLVNYTHNSHPKGQHKQPAAEARAGATNHPARPTETTKLRATDILNKQFLQRLDDELHLAPDQHEAIQKIVGDRQSQMRKVIQDAHLAIREVLAPPQQQQYDLLMKRNARRTLSNTNAPVAAPAGTNTPATNAPAI